MEIVSNGSSLFIRQPAGVMVEILDLYKEYI